MLDSIFGWENQEGGIPKRQVHNSSMFQVMFIFYFGVVSRIPVPQLLEATWVPKVEGNKAKLVEWMDYDK